MSCSICGHVEESGTHAVLECPIASHVWQGSGLDESLWTTKYRTPTDCIDRAKRLLDGDGFVDFLAVLWECWNAHNRFIFSKPDGNLHTLGRRAIDFVKSYRDAKESEPASAPAKRPTE